MYLEIKSCGYIYYIYMYKYIHIEAIYTGEQEVYFILFNKRLCCNAHIFREQYSL